MRITLDKSESLDIAIVDGNQIVGTVSLAIRGITLSGPTGSASTGTSAPTGAKRGRKRGRKRQLSADARARMAEAQRKRWDAYRTKQKKK